MATAPGQAPYGAPAPIAGERAGFGIRLGGFLLDGLLYGLLGLVFLIPAIALGIGAFDDCVWLTSDDTAELICPPGEPDGGMLAAAIGLGIVGYLLVFFIYLRALAKKGQTWGRKVVGIKVVGETTGEPLGYGRALGRTLFAGLISAQIFYIGYLWMLWDDKKQTLHDKVVSSIVIRA